MEFRFLNSLSLSQLRSPNCLSLFQFRSLSLSFFLSLSRARALSLSLSLYIYICIYLIFSDQVGTKNLNWFVLHQNQVLLTLLNGKNECKIALETLKKDINLLLHLLEIANAPKRNDK
jgi:hypothetical protein